MIYIISTARFLNAGILAFELERYVTREWEAYDEKTRTNKTNSQEA
jgi:hypothetical protein